MRDIPLMSKRLPKPPVLALHSVPTNNGDETRAFYVDSGYLVINYFSPGKSTDVEGQLELPLESLGWVKSTIVNGFWRLPSQGGLKKNQHTVESSFNDEFILISRSMNAGEYEKKGFTITNKSRPNHQLDIWPQKIQLTDDLIVSHLLPAIEEILKGSP